MRALPLRAALWSVALTCTVLFAFTAVFAQSEHVPAQTAKPGITLEPSALPDPAIYPLKPGDASFKSAPANYHVFAPVHAGEYAAAETLTLKFSAATQLTKIESTKDFVIDAGSTCQAGNRYSEGDSCNLLVRFTPQGAGHRLGKITITQTASPEPMSLGLVGNGYAPVISFTPAEITTVSGTYPSSKGLLSGANNMTVDGGDTVYIADTGNKVLREIDSSGAIATYSPVFGTAPNSVAVDTMGNAYTPETVTSENSIYFEVYPIDNLQSGWFNTYTAGTCTQSSPCELGTVGLGSPANFSMDPYDNLFTEEATHGAAEMPVGGYFAGGLGVDPDLWYLYDEFSYSDGTQAFAVDQNDNLYTSWDYSAYCYILEDSSYSAETSDPTYNLVAGGSTCGFSGDGGQARNAEINTPIGQITFDIAGNLYFSDTHNQRVRRIDASTGIINTIAGDGTAGYYGDGNPATGAELNAPTGVAVDSQGQVYIISSAATGQVVRKLGVNGLLNLGSQLRNTSGAARLVTVANTGNDSMVLTRAYIGGANPGDFAIDPNTTSCNLTANAVLNSGQSCKVGIIFTPSAAGARAASLIFLDNTVTNMNTVLLIGTGTLPSPTFTITAPSSGATETSGTPFTFSVSVTSSSGPQPTGTATMLLNGTAISGSPATLNSSGVASLSVTSTTTGTNTLSATYSGDSNYSADGPITRTVTVDAPAVTSKSKVAVTSSANPATACSAIAFSITVTGSGSEKPTGTVKLMKGTELLGEATLSKGAAKLPNIRLGAGTSKLTAHYNGDATHEAATSAPFKEMVSAGAGCAAEANRLRPINDTGELRAR